jgi:hypothetical protein
MRLQGIFLTSAAVLVFSGILAACTVVVDEGPGYRPPPPPRPGPQFCTREYAPVCGRQGPRMKTFPNSCEAGRAGYRIAYGGQCQGGGGGWSPQPRPPQPGPPPRPRPPQACTMEYRPVCATRRGQVRTFSNACSARAEDWRIVDSQGPC